MSDKCHPPYIFLERWIRRSFLIIRCWEPGNPEKIPSCWSVPVIETWPVFPCKKIAGTSNKKHPSEMLTQWPCFSKMIQRKTSRNTLQGWFNALSSLSLHCHSEISRTSEELESEEANSSKTRRPVQFRQWGTYRMKIKLHYVHESFNTDAYICIPIYLCIYIYVRVLYIYTCMYRYWNLASLCTPNIFAMSLCFKLSFSWFESQVFLPSEFDDIRKEGASRESNLGVRERQPICRKANPRLQIDR